MIDCNRNTTLWDNTEPRVHTHNRLRQSLHSKRYMLGIGQIVIINIHTSSEESNNNTEHILVLVSEGIYQSRTK